MPSGKQVARRQFMATGAATVAAVATANVNGSPNIHNMIPDDFRDLIGTNFEVETPGKVLSARLVQVEEIRGWNPPANHARRHTFVLVFEPQNGHLEADGSYRCSHRTLPSTDLCLSNFGTGSQFQTVFS